VPAARPHHQHGGPAARQAGHMAGRQRRPRAPSADRTAGRTGNAPQRARCWSAAVGPRGPAVARAAPRELVDLDRRGRGL